MAGTFKDISRKWEKGDKIEITFDMKCNLIDAPATGSNPESKYFQALIFGPIVLSRDENVDQDYDQPVQVISDKNRIVNIKQVKPVLNSTRMEFLVPTTEGEIRMCDYASVDSWEGKKICTWLPMRR